MLDWFLKRNKKQIRAVFDALNGIIITFFKTIHDPLSF